MIKIVSWNVNSIRSRIDSVKKFIDQYRPDILLLQEIKCVEEQFPFDEFHGFNILVNGQKSYNGVAILSKFPFDRNETIMKLAGDEMDEQARYLEAIIFVDKKPVRIASIYAPNGGSEESSDDITKTTKFQYKMNFYDRLYKRMEEISGFDEMVVFGGDYNIAPEAIDVWSPQHLEGSIGFHPLERVKLKSIINLGYQDSFRTKNPKSSEFTWWDYKGNGFKNDKGMRIDHILTSPLATDLLAGSGIYTETRSWDKPSDHAPIYCEFDL